MMTVRGLVFGVLALVSCTCGQVGKLSKLRPVSGVNYLEAQAQNSDSDVDRLAPSYMLDLYERNKYSAVKKGNDRATTVRMINGELGKVRQDEGRMFSFNLSTVLASEKILSAELHIYKKEGLPTDPWKDIQVLMYVVNPKFVRTIGQDWLYKKQYGWQVLDITRQVKRCLKHQKRSHSLGIQLKHNRPKDLKLKRKNSRPFLVIYSNETQNLTIDHIDPRFKPKDLVTLENHLKRNGFHVEKERRRMRVHEVKEFLQADEHVEHVQKPAKRVQKLVDHVERVQNHVLEENATNDDENKTQKMDKRGKRSVFDNQVPKIAGGEKVEAIMLPIGPGMKFPKPNEFPFSSTDPSILTERSRLRNTKYGDGYRYKKNKKDKTIPYPRGFRKRRRRNRRKRRRWNRRHRARFDDSLWQNSVAPTARIPDSVCQRRRLTVNFQDIGWNKWIINPKSFDAYYCSGTCPFQKIKSLSPSNHATIQSIVHAVGIYRVPEPCCVPRAMSSVSLLFFDENGNVVLKNYPQMSVERCSCQ